MLCNFLVTMVTLKNGMNFFSMWVFFHEHSRFTGLQGKGEGILLTPHYRFHPLRRHLGIKRVITAERSPLSSVFQTGLRHQFKSKYYKQENHYHETFLVNFNLFKELCE